ncbi:hypothetical protein E4U43_003330 [Claviceps pusilla]|uniref:Uncharacterized protein n=1 Tax=Claviceps pusilla TaxID=123648 RepID=A0A9P7T242_9HYPO|nr:hypothetical protein E4U43_003330 [Claviceps pusilla]
MTEGNRVEKPHHSSESSHYAQKHRSELTGPLFTPVPLDVAVMTKCSSSDDIWQHMPGTTVFGDPFHPLLPPTDSA